MLKKFKDFDVEKYKVRTILEKLDENIESSNYDETIFMDTPISDDPYLLKMTKVIMNALIKQGLTDYAPYGTVVYVNGVPGVWFSHVDNEKRSIIACRNKYTKIIAVFDDFRIDGNNTAIVTYSSEKVGLLDMINQAIDDLKNGELNESVLNEAFRAKAGYGMGHIKKVAAWTDAMKEFCVNALSTGMTASKLAGEILKNLSNPICEDIYNSFDRKDTTLKYATNVIWDAMNHTYPEVEGVLEGKLAAATPSLRKTIDEDFDVEAYEADKEAKRKEAIAKAQVVFEENTQIIIDTVDTFCHYVKQNGQLDDDDMSVFTTRGLYITGRAGSGKSYALRQTLKKNGMVDKKDYIDVGNGATNADALYRLMYKYNGKLIILDDAANVVGGSTRVAFWKQLLQTDPTPVKNPRETNEDSKMYYEVGKKTRQERYFAEIGQKTEEEKKEFIKKKKREYGYGKARATSSEDKAIMNDILAEWDEAKKTAKPLIPDEFVFTGCVVVVGNMTHAELQDAVTKSGGKRDWDAIKTRFQPIEIDPPYEVMWNVIQKELRKQQEMSEEELPSYSCIVPREYIDDFIDEVNYLLEGNEDDGYEYTAISWRLAVQIGQAFKGEKGRRLWKRKLRETLRVTEK